MTRRNFVLLLALLFAFGLTIGCGTSVPPTDPPADTSPQPDPEPDPEGSGFYAWSPEDGPRFLAPGEGYSIRMVADAHFPGVRFYVHHVPSEVRGDDHAAIVFKWLTDQPLFALTDSPDRIEEYVASFDLEAFLSSWRLEFELESALLDEEPVTDLMILEALGPPSSRTTHFTETGRIERWEYAQFRIVLYFSDSVMTTVVTY